MTLILAIGLLLAAAAAVLFVRAWIMPRVRATETLGHVGAYGFTAAAAPASLAARSARRRVPGLRHQLESVASSVGGSLSRRVPGLRPEELQRRLLAAGYYTTNPRVVIGYQTLAAIVLPSLWLWFATSAGASASATVLGTIITPVAGWMLPIVYLKRRGEHRATRIDYEMPELIDILVTTVEAGIGFSASLQIAAKRFDSPLGEELRLTLQEQSMGLDLKAALNNLLVRADTPSVRSFVRALVQGELLGVSIGQTLRSLVGEMRKRRRQLAEERAQKAPVKMLFPLVFLIFPSMFLILLGPAALRIFDIFGG